MEHFIFNITTELSKGRCVLLDMPSDCKYILGKICEEAETSQSINFEGIEKGVFHHSEYTSPCNKFKEIKKIILNTNAAKGLTNEFSGILMIDITEWLNHESENYFSILLKFLHDKNKYWKYVFVLTSDDSRKKERLYQELLKMFRCVIINDKTSGINIAKELIDKVALRENVVFEESAEKELVTCCSKNALNEHIIENLVMDIICETPTGVIKATDIKAYFENPNCIYCKLYDIEKEKEGSVVRG